VEDNDHDDEEEEEENDDEEEEEYENARAQMKDGWNGMVTTECAGEKTIYSKKGGRYPQPIKREKHLYTAWRKSSTLAY
jgi:hypothetical protein